MSFITVDVAASLPEEARLDVRVSMTVADARRLVDQIHESPHRTRYPLWKLMEALNSAIQQANKHFTQQAIDGCEQVGGGE